MKTRILTAVIGIPALLLVLLLPWTMVLTCAIVFISVMAVYEVLKTAEITQHRALTAAALLFSAAAPFFNRLPAALVMLLCLIYVLALLVIYLRAHKAVSVEKLAVSFFMSFYVAISLSCASYLRMADEHGLFYLFLSFGIAWFADAGAYFVGTFLGRHKLCPEISPKKTVEGLIGGLVASVGLTLLMGWIYESCFLNYVQPVSYWTLLVLSVLGAVLSVMGDLFASLIKRQYGVKDFGTFFPGHGGMMDRFDSLLPVFPLVYFTISYLPIIL